MKIFLILFLALLYAWSAHAQSDTCDLKISLLTCGPGEDLYSVFGHSALRVVDRTAGSDIIYNYGTFEFDDPDFYVKFVRGKLLYFLSTETFPRFMYAYQMENRFVIEQVLHLTCNERHRLVEALRTNALDQNKFYEYEFLFDNCSTRLRDIVGINAEDSVRYKRIIAEPAPTFREILHVYLDRGKKDWSAFGIDLLLGSRIDRKMKNEESMFLPEYLMTGFDSSQVRTHSLVQSKQLILPASEKNISRTPVTPLVATIALLIAGLAITFWKRAATSRFASVFDGLFFFTLGIMGCLMLFMWYGTDHELCRNNYNLYWALPTHIIAAFVAHKQQPLIRKYFTISAILCVVFVCSWPFLPQGMNSAFFPLVLLSGIRSFYLSKKNDHAGTWINQQ